MISFSTNEAFFASLIVIGLICILFVMLQKPQEESPRSGRDRRSVDFQPPVDVIGEVSLLERKVEQPEATVEPCLLEKLQEQPDEQKLKDASPAPGPVRDHVAKKAAVSKGKSNEMTALDWWVSEQLELPEQNKGGK